MYRFLGKILLVCLFGMALAVNQARAETLWVSSSGATLKMEPAASAVTLSELTLGSELQILEKSQRWYKVQTASGQQGWIYRGKVSAQKPLLTDSGSGGSAGDLLGGLTGSNIAANSADSSRSIRGLSPDAEAYAEQSGASDAARRALDEVIAHPTQPEVIERFLQDSKIGEYAEE